ncbi:MAG: metal-dependent hydrolase [Promethearchaeota archaeon]|jgi:membrane-bound metal-dependent hydrolase YbcI (DUF457 family)
MKLEHHIAFSTLVSGILYLIFKSWGLSIASLISGIFIDIDHIFDYFIEHRMHFEYQKFMDFFYREKHQKITLLFHAWEWLLCIGLVTVLTNFNPWITGLFVGYGHHIISDYFYSKASIKTYSLIWRWRKKFNSELIFPRNRGYDP